MIRVMVEFRKRDGMGSEDLVRYCREVHVPLLFSIPESRLMDDFVVSFPAEAEGFGRPGFDAMVEISFRSIEDMSEFYESENFRTLIDPDHANFIDPESVVRFLIDDRIVAPSRSDA